MKLARFCFLMLGSVLLAACGGGRSGGGGGQQPPSNPAIHSEWTWVSGSRTSGQQSVSVGGAGTTSPTDTPGAREGAVTWRDAAGNLWLFGGVQWTSPEEDQGSFSNGLWEFHDGQWTWVSGDAVANESPIYGTLGVPDSQNRPGARAYATGWTDPMGNFWLFGGLGYGSDGGPAELNDLWKYSGGKWIWMSGSDVTGREGIYGTQGSPAPDNVPGARFSASAWTDAFGNLWLFGGFVFDIRGAQPGVINYTGFNDLWKYSGGEWTWVGGSTLAFQPGVYGTQGTPAAGSTPGSRAAAATWIDRDGNLWLFGGANYDPSTGNFSYFNDLWKYSAGEWTWMGGSDLPDEVGVYGSPGAPAAINIPGARVGAVTWIDLSGNLWLMGGSFNGDDYNDLWKYSSGQWTWMSGSNGADQAGSYGTQGSAASSNVPGARYLASAWMDTSGNLWLFGGNGYDSADNQGDLNGLWEYRP